MSKSYLSLFANEWQTNLLQIFSKQIKRKHPSRRNLRFWKYFRALMREEARMHCKKQKSMKNSVHFLSMHQKSENISAQLKSTRITIHQRHKPNHHSKNHQWHTNTFTTSKEFVQSAEICRKSLFSRRPQDWWLAKHNQKSYWIAQCSTASLQFNRIA